MRSRHSTIYFLGIIRGFSNSQSKHLQSSMKSRTITAFYQPTSLEHKYDLSRSAHTTGFHEITGRITTYRIRRYISQISKYHPAQRSQLVKCQQPIQHCFQQKCRHRIIIKSIYSNLLSCFK